VLGYLCIYCCGYRYSLNNHVNSCIGKLNRLP